MMGVAVSCYRTKDTAASGSKGSLSEDVSLHNGGCGELLPRERHARLRAT